MRTVYFCEESRGIKYFLEAVNPLCELSAEPGVASEEDWVVVAPVQGAGERGTRPPRPPPPVPGEVAGREQRGAGTAR